jgi:hypothetical protein
MKASIYAILAYKQSMFSGRGRGPCNHNPGRAGKLAAKRASLSWRQIFWEFGFL